MLENEQVLLAHSPPGMGVSLTIFLKRGSKIGLKFNVLGARSLKPAGVALWNYHVACRWAGVITRGQLLGGTTPLKFGRTKNIQNLVRFMTTFDFDCEYLWTGWRYQQVVNSVINHILSHVEQKNLVNFGPLTPEITWLMFTYPKSSVRVLWILVHLTLGHVTLPPREFHLHEFSPNLT